MLGKTRMGIFLLMICFLSQACAGFQEFIDIKEIFKGNTERDPENYRLEDKMEYRKHHYLLKAKEKEQDKEILKRMKQNEKKKPSAKR